MLHALGMCMIRIRPFLLLHVPVTGTALRNTEGDRYAYEYTDFTYLTALLFCSAAIQLCSLLSSARCVLLDCTGQEQTGAAFVAHREEF